MTLTDSKCPNCGASVFTDVCEYCGTKFRKHTDFIVNIVHDETPASTVLKALHRDLISANEALRLGGNSAGMKLWNDIKALPVKNVATRDIFSSSDEG